MPRAPAPHASHFVASNRFSAVGLRADAAWHLTLAHRRVAYRRVVNRPMPPAPAFVRVPSPVTARLRLFVFPHSGSGAYPYRAMSASLPPWVELSILQLPGRETLFNAPMYHAMKPLVDAALPAIAPQLELPCVFFGHSLGAYVAFELVRGLRRTNASSPRALVVSGTRAPHLPLRREPLHELPTRRLIDELRRYGGTPEAILQNQELMDIFLPPLRADLTIFETYAHAPEAPFDFMISAFGGRNDHRMDPGDLEAWRQHTTGRFSLTHFDGGHFYLLGQSRTAFLTVLRETLETLG